MERSVEGVGRAMMLRPQRALIEGLERRVLFSAGALDSTFGNGGEVVTDVNGTANHGNAVAVQSDGKIVVAGDTVVGGVNEFAVLRYNVDGHLDDGSPADITPGDKFGTGGKVLTQVTGSGATATSVVIQPDGKIVVGGTETLFNSLLNQTFTDFVVVRYNKDGSLDTSFGSAHSGIVTGGLATSTLTSASLNALALQADGKIVAVGATGGEFAVERFTTSGMLDTSFQGGKVLTSFPGDAIAYGVAIAGDGGIVVVGSTAISNNATQAAIARYDAKGALDPNFNFDGKLSTRLGSVNGPAGRAVAIQPDGIIDIACDINTDAAMGLAQLSPTGVVDSNLNGRTRNGAANAGIVIQRDGAIVLGGYTTFDFLSGFVFILDRYTANGSPDSSFGDGSESSIGFSGGNPVAEGISLAPDGKIVIAGYADVGGPGQNFAIARVQSTPTASLASFSGQVFTDTDGDGVKDSNELPTVDARVYDDSNGNGSFDPGEQSVLTDLKGNYRIERVGHTPFPHFYQLKLQLPSTAFTQTLPVKNGDYFEAALPGSTAGNLNFGIHPPKSNSLTTHISGSVFNDLNGNGLRDILNPTEPNLTGWKVYLDQNKDGKFDAGDISTLTDGGGNFLFDHLAVGSYRVRLVVQSGYRQTTPGLGYFDLTIKHGQQIVNQTFGVTKNVLISGRVVTVQSFGDAKIVQGLPGWLVYAQFNILNRSEEIGVLTDSMGNWSFTSLAASSSPYVIHVVPMPKWVGFTPSISVTLATPGSSKTGLGFTERKLA
jgi:uncharacterized delta-60 repeat protein